MSFLQTVVASTKPQLFKSTLTLSSKPQILTTTIRRNFSQRHKLSSKPAQKEWLAHIPDFPNSLDKRKEVRPKHLARIQPFIEDRTIVMGGAFLHKQPDGDEFPDMAGSFILVQAETREEAVEFLRDDPYTKGGVWNLDAMTIYPFKTAFRTPTG